MNDDLILLLLLCSPLLFMVLIVVLDRPAPCLEGGRHSWQPLKRWTDERGLRNVLQECGKCRKTEHRWGV